MPRNPECKSWPFSRRNLGALIALGALAAALAAALFWPGAGRRAALLDPMHQAGANIPPTPEPEYRSGPPMTWNH